MVLHTCLALSPMLFLRIVNSHPAGGATLGTILKCRVKKKRQSRDESQQPAEQNVTSCLWCHLVIVVFWPPHSGHALNVEPDEIVEGGAGVEDDPEEGHLVLLLLFEKSP